MTVGDDLENGEKMSEQTPEDLDQEAPADVEQVPEPEVFPDDPTTCTCLWWEGHPDYWEDPHCPTHGEPTDGGEGTGT